MFLHSQAAADVQVDAPVLGLSSTLTHAALGTGWLLCHKAGRQSAMRRRVGLGEFYEFVSGRRGHLETSHLLITVSLWGGGFLFRDTSVPVFLNADKNTGDCL